MAKDSIMTNEQLLNENRLLKNQIAELEQLKFNSKIWLENSPVCTNIVDLDFNLQYMSSAGISALKIKDITEFYGKPFPPPFYPEAFKTAMNEKLRRSKETGETIIYEAPLQDLEGNTLWFNTSIVPVNNIEGKIDYLLVVSVDVTARKKAEQALASNKEELELTAKIAQLGGWSIDVKTLKPYFNKETVEIFELQHLKGLSVEQGMKYFTAEDRPKMERAIQDCLNYGKSYDLELSIITEKGNMRWVRVSGKAESENGEFVKLSGFIQNITEKKLIEKKIRTAEESLKRTFDISPSIICTANVDANYFVKVNQAVTRILGYSAEEFISKPILDFVHPDDRHGTADIVTEQLNGSDVTFFENRYLCKDGTYKWIAWHGTKADENGMVTAVGSDITERKQAELSIKRFFTAVEQSPSVIVITDSEGKLDYVNPKFTELTGYSSLEVIGQESNILKSGEQNSAFYREMWHKVESGCVWRGNFHNKKKNGELFWEAASISAIFSEAGEIINYIKIAEDITELKKIEDELISAKEKAEESERLKSAFLANMSHEIRTPMNGIIGFISLLNEPNLSQTKIEKYTAIIKKSSDRLLNTINDIIDISKIESEEMSVTFAETSVNSVMEELYSFFLPEAKTKGLSLLLETILPLESSIIITDSHKLHGILSNLIKNAIKYTESGEIAFGSVLNTDTEPSSVEIFVRDTGVGIPEERLSIIFNRFEQADISDSRIFEGSGLGLAISKAYAAMLDGEISVISEVGKGSTFTFKLPLTR